MNQIGLHWWDYGIIVLYFAGMLSIGWYFSKRNKDATDFLLGGRKMPFFPIAVSMLMTVFSTYSLVMSPGEIYNHGLDWGIISFVMPFIGVLGVLLVVPPPQAARLATMATARSMDTSFFIGVCLLTW